MQSYDQFIQSRLTAGESIEEITAHLHSALEPLAKRCAFCGLKAELFCDYIVGWTNMEPSKHSKQNMVFNTKTSMPLTCDMPLCAACAVQRGMRTSTGESFNYAETEDWCPDHQDSDGNPVPMTDKEAESCRKQRRMVLLAGLK
jgi:hypothetical protein